MERAGRWLQPGGVGVALPPAALALVLASGTLLGGFVFDDVPLVQENSRIERLSSLPQLFLEGYWGKHVPDPLYRPLTLASFAVETALWGRRSAVPFHAVNALLYALSAGLVAVVAHRLGAGARAAVAAGLVFACHPIHVEPVAAVVGRSDLAAGVLVLLGIASASGPARSWGRAALTSAALLAAMLFKEVGIALLPVLLLLPLVDLRGRVPGRGPFLSSVAQRWRTWILVAVALLIWLGLRSLATPPAEALAPPSESDNPLAMRDAAGRVAGALAVTCRHAWMTVWPWPLSADYSFRAIVPTAVLLSLPAVAGCLFWTLGGAGVLALARRAPLASLGIALYLAGLLPSSNLVFPIGTVFAERLLHVPTIGACLALAALLDVPLARAGAWRAVAWLVILVAVLLGSVGFLARVPEWRDERSLFEAVVRVQPESAKGQSNLGRALVEEGRATDVPASAELLGRAREELARALNIIPDYVPAHVNMANALVLQSEPGRALGHAETAYRLEPDTLAVIRTLAHVSVRNDRLEQAAEACDRGLGIAPTDVELLGLRAEALFRLSRFSDAATSLRTLFELTRDPQYAIRLVHARRSAGDRPAAREALERILEVALAPDAGAALVARRPEFLSKSALVHAVSGEFEAAVSDASAALEADPEHVEAREVRARSLMALDRQEEAEADLEALAELLGEEALDPLRRELAAGQR